MHAHQNFRQRPANLLAGLLSIAVALTTARAQPESSGAWMGYYGPVLGLAPDGLPGHSEWVDQVTAIVSDPAHLAGLGVDGAKRGEKVVLTNRDNGYWTIELTSNTRKVTIPLAYLVRFGVMPDHDMSAEKVPERITGQVVLPEVLAQYEFSHPAKGERFTLQFENGGWWLTLEPGGERKCVPF